MNKVIYLMFALLLCLCSCSKTPTVSESSGESSESMSTQENSIAESENCESKGPSSTVVYNVPSYESNAVSEETVQLGKIKDFGGVYRKAMTENATRKTIICGENGELDYTEEIPVVKYWVTDGDGNLLINHPFDEMLFNIGSPGIVEEYMDLPTVEGCNDGSYYRYVFADGSFFLESHEQPGECGGFTKFGKEYCKTKYFYHFSYDSACDGLNDSEGNVIFEPIYNGIGIPFEDRFLLGSGDGDGTDPDSRVFTLIDLDGNFLAQFNSIRYFVFDDGSYLGIAYSAGNEEYAQCYDENGVPREYGYWFVDKDGKIISPWYYQIHSTHVSSSDDIISATDADGNAIEIKASDYICKP